MIFRKVFLIYAFKIVFINSLIAQWTPGPGNQDTLNLLLISGGYVYFKFKSINDVQNGIEYTDWSNFYLYFDDDDIDDNLKLTCYANTSLSYIVGERGEQLNLDEIEVRAICSGCTGVTETGWQTLTNAPGADLLTGFAGDGSPGDTYDIHIDFRCGNSGLINQPYDYYYVDIIFDVE